MRKYKKPVLNVEQFTANEFISTCSDTVNEYYKFECNAGGGNYGDVYEDTNKNNKLDLGDKELTGWFIKPYHACGATHYVKKGEEGTTFTNGWYRQLGSTTTIPVVIWKGENNDNVHTTTALETTIETVKGNFS